MTARTPVRVCLDAKQLAFARTMAEGNQASLGSVLRIALDYFIKTIAKKGPTDD
ncbi:hypothetical protein [Rhizobium sp. PL01]|uniref:hypothetical protein n=1 Tax=Rhizobium sp. PL01 TaxID=3085631 RepID=UPI00298188AB|nr:hypothetical protein [Rhizobium sp. PL01]MDW5313669.1 hypothetical protein [Rhizobium sp. PL01]